MKYLKLFETFESKILYHGTDKLHEFNDHGYIFDGTFFSSNPNEAQTYGQHIYKVKLNDNLNLFDTFNDKDLKLLLKVFGELNNTYYEPDEKGYKITKPSQMRYDDNWNPIEKTPGVVSWLKRYYDGIWLHEGGVRNLLLFSPVKDKLKSIELFNFKS